MELVTRKKLYLVAGRATRPLAEEIAAELGESLGEPNIAEFANGEIHCRFGESVRGTDVFIIQTHAAVDGRSVNDALMEQLIMVDAARRARLDAETESRTTERLAEFRAAARREIGAAGTPLLAERTEANRGRWVDDRMVAIGRARASSLGFPDAYAFTKALGERALVERRGAVPVSIVRPSIIE